MRPKSPRRKRLEGTDQWAKLHITAGTSLGRNPAADLDTAGKQLEEKFRAASKPQKPDQAKQPQDHEGELPPELRRK
jgi:hypothetical protein